jgi:hypothetical protein
MHLAMSSPSITDVIRAAIQAPSADNSQPWRFSLHNHTLHCHYEHAGAFLDPFGSLSHASLLAGACVHENLHQMFGQAVTARLGTEAWSLEVDVQACPPPNPALQARIDARHTNRHPYGPMAGVPTLPAPEGRTRVHCTPRDASRKVLSHALRVCSQARFNQQELHEWLFTSLRWSEAETRSGDGLDIATLHLPPGGRHFMAWIKPWSRMQSLNRVGLDYFMSVVDSSLLTQAPLVLAITGPRDARGIWDAGRTLQRVWLELNAQGHAVHPYYAITDLGNRQHDHKLPPRWDQEVSTVVQACHQTLGLAPDEQIHMLLRVGSPRTAPVRSKRRPIDSFLAAASTD